MTTNIANGFGFQSTLTINHERAFKLGASGTAKKRQAIQRFMNLVAKGSETRLVPSFHLLPNSTGYGQRALATWGSSSGSGSMVCTINGVDTTVTYATSDINTASLMATAINASTDPLVQYIVKATRYLGTIALASVAAGDVISVCGYKFKAISGTPLQLGQFDMSGTNTQDAAALAAAINKMPGLSEKVIATSSSANVTIHFLSNAAPTTQEKIVRYATTFTVTAIAAVAFCSVYAVQPGVLGNCVTIAASGTGASIVGSLARLAGGVGGNVTDVGSTL